MTNFFGSVMETIHTDSAYRIHQRKDTDKGPMEKLVHHGERTLIPSNKEDQISDSKTQVINSLVTLLTIINVDCFVHDCF